jgi:hypothetical protein
VVIDGKRVDPEKIEHPDIDHTRLPDPVAEAMSCLVDRIAGLERQIADLRAGRVQPADEARDRDPDEDCLPSVQEEIATILGLNPGAGI